MSPTASAESTVETDQSTVAAPVELRALRKVYGRRVALHGLDLRVEQGEVFGLLGPNGAGKSTTVKILAGLVRATSGEARVFGLPARSPAARRNVGYLPENFRYHDWLSGSALLDFHGRLAGLDRDRRRRRIPAVLSLVGLAGRGDDRVSGYSKGMTQRLGIAVAILHQPPLVLLDEPTSALDPVGRRETRQLIERLRAEGTTILLNSHLLGEVELVCDRIAIIDHGRLVTAGTPGDLVGTTTTARLTVDRVDGELLALLRRLAIVLDAEERSVVLDCADSEVFAMVATAVVRAGYRLYSLAPERRSLEDVFVTAVNGTAPSEPVVEPCSTR